MGNRSDISVVAAKLFPRNRLSADAVEALTVLKVVHLNKLANREVAEHRKTKLAVIFYPNVTTLHSGLCCRNSVCRLSSVCNVGAPYSGG